MERRNGGTAERWNGETEEGRNGGTAERRNGGMAEWRKMTLNPKTQNGGVYAKVYDSSRNLTPRNTTRDAFMNKYIHVRELIFRLSRDVSLGRLCSNSLIASATTTSRNLTSARRGCKIAFRPRLGKALRACLHGGRGL